MTTSSAFTPRIATRASRCSTSRATSSPTRRPDFPCNQFGNQAPGTDDEIHEFCTLKFGTEFPQFKKIDVNGDGADPLFADLATEMPFQGFGKGLKAKALEKFTNANNKQFGDKAYIKWNFTKFLVDREGKLVARFEPTTEMDEVEQAIAKLV